MAASVIKLTTPGVYVQEIPTFPPSVAEVETAIPAFIGYTEKASKAGADLKKIPTKVTDFSQYRLWFGAPQTEAADAEPEPDGPRGTRIEAQLGVMHDDARTDEVGQVRELGINQALDIDRLPFIPDEQILIAESAVDPLGEALGEIFGVEAKLRHLRGGPARRRSQDGPESNPSFAPQSPNTCNNGKI
jgi:hypothetical protein